MTSTIPIEVPLAAGRQIIDLNNLFINAADPLRYVRIAEAAGFPRNCCAWIRGLYGLIQDLRIRRVIFVTGGDCSNTHALMETLKPDLSEMLTFSYPYPGEKEALSREIDRFCSAFAITRTQAEQKGTELSKIRQMLAELDRLTWQTDTISGEDNFRWLVSSSDFQGNPATYQSALSLFRCLKGRPGSG
ncbi:MAG TPA: 2-hydroxyacyl-CoA dehydratase, partial [Candidatus Ozemobacteraceae bacterium]|nr:2-hydroxyacyl-CoA dehydratase [Candidatus Ozemobacteraceae bacterium]